MNNFADVILPLPLPKPFTYSIPERLTQQVGLFTRATVPFGKNKLYSGIIIALHDNKPTGYQTKDIIDILDDSPIINKHQFDLWMWLSDYYMCTIGEVMKAAMPSGLKLESETRVFFNPHFDKEISFTPTEQLIISVLDVKNMATIGELNKLEGVKNILPVIKSLHQKQVIVLEEKLVENYKPKFESFVQLASAYNTETVLNKTLTELEKAPKQMAILVGYLSMSDYFKNWTPLVKRTTLLKKTDTNHQALNVLVNKGVFEIIEKEESRIKEFSINETKPFLLSDVQKKVIHEIKSNFSTLNAVLLHGVTSSGKTEIYIHLIKEYIDAGKQVLYLLPEIALTTQIITRLQKVFGDKVGIYHSKFSDSERVEVYNEILKSNNDNNNGRFSIILGVRSSVFLPFSNLGFIIVDEEHENTYKQFDPAPRYHARDVAIVLAKQHGAKVLLGTATPSLESYFNATQQKYGLVEIHERYKKIQLPEIHLVNIREARRRKMMNSLFSPLLLETIQEALQAKEQVILFQNRRGFSPYLECETCGWIPRCEYCDVSLTYHKSNQSLQCHYCGYSIHIPKKCKACGSQDLVTRGFGTEKIEEEIALFFPEARVARMDLDNVRTRKSYEKLIHDFESQKIEILIGTQMLSKGLDFNNVSVVGIMNADNLLNFPDFRAHERSFQLITQVSGRAGRDKKRGKVIIQCSEPEHDILQYVLNNHYKMMFQREISHRKLFKYPPFYRIIRLNVKHKQTDILAKASDELANKLKETLGNRVIGPEYPLVNRIQKYYIKIIMIKVERDRSMQKARELIREALNEIFSLEGFRTVQVAVDVDPM